MPWCGASACTEDKILKLGFLKNGFDTRPQLRRKLALRVYGFENGLPAVFQLAEIGELFLDGPDLNFIEIACDFFPIARDEGTVEPSSSNSMVAVKLFKLTPSCCEI